MTRLGNPGRSKEMIEGQPSKTALLENAVIDRSAALISSPIASGPTLVEPIIHELGSARSIAIGVGVGVGVGVGAVVLTVEPPELVRFTVGASARRPAHPDSSIPNAAMATTGSHRRLET
jgi:hypothetical protein